MAPSKKKQKPISRSSAPNLRRRLRDPGIGSIPAKGLSFTDSTKITALRAPEPLPPSPADSDPGGWLKEGGTSPTKIPDLGALAGTGNTDPGSLPSWAKPQRLKSEDSSDAGQYEESGPKQRPQRPASPRIVVRPAPRLPLLMTALLCLAIGIVAGALLQSRLGAATCPDPAAHSQSASPAQ